MKTSLSAWWLVATLALNAAAGEFFIAADGQHGDGSGRAADHAADASTPEKFRAINQAQNAPGTVIVYASGTYLCSPAFAMFDGVTHRGAGIDATVIKVAPGGATGEFAPLWLAERPTISRFEFTDATIDFDATRNDWWSRGTGCSIAFAFSTADHCAIRRVKFVNMGAKQRESFPIFFITNHSAKGNLHDNVVDACVFTSPVPSGNTDGLTCVMLADAPPDITVDHTNRVINCRFVGLKAPEYSDLAYTQCVTAPAATGNYAAGVDSLWFAEPGSQTLGDKSFYPGLTVRVSGNTLEDCGAVAQILMHPNGRFAADLLVESNTSRLAQHPYQRQGPRGPQGVTVEQYWPGNPPLLSITVRGNTFIAPLPLRPGFPPVAVNVNPTAGPGKYFHLAGLSVSDNVLVNFPGDGSEFNIASDPAYVPNPSVSGNQIVPPPKP